jgi:hypothetical protein
MADSNWQRELLAREPVELDAVEKVAWAVAMLAAGAMFGRGGDDE